MKRIVIVLMLFIACQSVEAQKLSFGPMAGFRLTTSSSNLAELDKTLTLQPTFNAGVFAHLKWKHIAIQPQLFFGGRGWSVKHNDHTDRTNIWAIDLPINVLYTRMGFYAGGGPVVSMHLGGSSTSRGLNGEEIKEDIKVGSGLDQIPLLNTGFQLMAGYSFLKFHGSLYYNFGISNVSNLDAVTIRTGMMGINLGYSLF